MSGRPIRQLSWIGILLGALLTLAAIFALFPSEKFNFWKILGSFLSAAPLYEHDSSYRFGRLVAYLLGTIFFSGVVVATLTNIIRTAGERYTNGTARYKFKDHVLFLGYDELMIGTLRQEMDSLWENDFVVAVPDNVAAVRNALYQQLSPQQCQRLIVIRASLVNVDDLAKVAQVLVAKKIFIIGQADDDSHDANILKSLGFISALSSSHHKDPIPCMYYLRNQSTFYLLHRIKFEAENFRHYILLAHLPYDKDLIELHINAAEPFNFHESIARHLLFGSLRDNEDTLRLDASQGDPHLVICGMSAMGLALMRDVLMTQHFPSRRLLLTLVDPNACDEMHRLLVRHRPLFDNCHYSFRNLDDPSQDFDHPARLDFLDFDIEFLQCDLAHPRLAELLRQWVPQSSGPSVTAIAVCTDSVQQNIALAIYMPREIFQARVPIWVYQTGDNSMNAFVETGGSNNLYSCIHVFSTLNYGISNRRQSSQWLLAKAVADDYAAQLNSQHSAINTQHWTRSLPKDRWSSLYAALSKIPMLRAIGKEAFPIRLSADEKKLLAIAEHNRWNTEKLLNGWEPAPKGVSKNLFFHDKIVSYEQLDEASKATDIRQIVAVVEALNRTSHETTLPTPAAAPDEPAAAVGGTPSLPPELLPLVERMAENVHLQWMQNRLDQGWTYGPERNDTLKTHPCLIPYADLPEEEKQYDRTTSLETLYFVLSQGFDITKEATSEKK